MEFEPGRRRSAVHEARWLNLLGFALRPGYGLAVDDWRVAQTWTTLQGKFAHAAANVRVEGWILWRRIGGGLAAGQQQALADPLLGLDPRPAPPTDHRQGPQRFRLRHPRNGRNVAAAGLAGIAPAGHEGRARRRCCWTCCRNERWSRSGPAMLWAIGRLGGPRADVRAAEYGRSGRHGRRLAVKLMAEKRSERSFGERARRQCLRET